MHTMILCTCPTAEVAELIASQLVGEKLAACVNILPGLRSVYQWQGVIETAQEHLLLIKTQHALYPAVEAAIKAKHPYEVPELIAVAIDRGSTEYLKWIDSCLVTH